MRAVINNNYTPLRDKGSQCSSRKAQQDFKALEGKSLDMNKEKSLSNPVPVPPTPGKKTRRVIIIESSDEETEADNLTAVFARLTTSPNSRTLARTPAPAPACTPPHAAAPAPAAVYTRTSARTPAPTSACTRAGTAATLALIPAPETPFDGPPGYYGGVPPPGPAPSPFKKSKYYVVSVGRCIGIYDDWNIVHKLTSGVSGACQRSYKYYGDALTAYAELKAAGLIQVKRQPGDELVFGPLNLAIQ